MIVFMFCQRVSLYIWGHLLFLPVVGVELVGFQKSATYAEQRLQAARSYSLIRPPRTG
jgi:hypothetical protein